MVPETSSTTDRIFCHFGQFLAHLPPKNPKNENFKKMEKWPGDITILHKCTKNYDHTVYCSWDMACEMYWLFFTLGYFLHFCLVTCSKNKNFKKIKKTPGDITFYTSVPKIMIICNTFPEIWHVTDVIVIFHFELFFALLQPKKSKFQKNEAPGDIIILHMYTKNYD